MMECENFISKFHSLEGITMGDKKKSFHLLLKTVESTSNELNAIIEKLIPTTYLEEYLKIEMLIYFKRTYDLLAILMKGEQIGAYKIAHQDWFVEELMNAYTPAQLISEILPMLSFSLRSKMFKRISVNVKNESIMEEFYDGILNTYGISNASIFLVGCSQQKIEESFNKFTVFFSASQLKMLFHKSKDLIEKYFILLVQNGVNVDNYKWKSFFSYLGKQDPLFYFKICDKFHIEKLKLGRQSTKQYVRAKRVHIINEPNEYYRILRKDVLVRELGMDFPLFYKNLMPKNIKQFRFFAAKSIIKYYPKKRQYDLYFSCFSDVYKKNLWDNVDYMDQKLIEFVQNKFERDKWISKFENRQNIQKYTRKKKCAMYFTENEGENIIRDKKTIFNTLISTCKLTKDYEAFINILKSFLDRHRNSDAIVMHNFLRNIYKELDLSLFRDEHWQYIYDIIRLQLYKEQQIFHPILLEYIKFLYIKGKPIDDLVYTLLNQAPLDLSKFTYSNYNFEKNMYVLYLKFLPKITRKKNEVSIQIALSLVGWNTKYRSDVIPFSKQNDIINAIIGTKNSEKNTKNIVTVLKYLICDQNGNQDYTELDNIFWSNYEKLNNPTITCWFIKYKPFVLKKNIDKIDMIIKNNNRNLLRTIRKYSHLLIPQDIVKSCLKALKNCKPSKCATYVKIMISFMDKSDLQSYVLQHIPRDEKMGDNTNYEDRVKEHLIQCALAKYLKISENIISLLPILLSYCIGNVLRSSLASLYSSFHRIPGHQLHFSLEILEKKPVSVKKHTIFLTCLVLPVKNVLLKYEQVLSAEKNISLRQHTFKSCYKYFIRNQLPECLPFIKKYLKELKGTQNDTLEMISNVHLIPRKYRAEYAEFVWNILDKFKKENVSISDYQFRYLNNLNINDIIQLNAQFSSKIIEDNLYNSRQCSFNSGVDIFSRNFLLYAEKSEVKAKSIITVLYKLKENLSNNFDEQMRNLEALHKFFLRLLSDVLSSTIVEKMDISFLKAFKISLSEIFSVEEIFEEIIFLELIIFRHGCSDFKNILPKRMNQLFSCAIQEHGHLILKRFQRCMKIIFDILYPYDELSVLTFLNSFLSENMSSNHCALVINLMPYISSDDETIDIFDKLLENFNSQDQIMKIILNGKLKNM